MVEVIKVESKKQQKEFLKSIKSDKTDHENSIRSEKEDI